MYELVRATKHTLYFSAHPQSLPNAHERQFHGPNPAKLQAHRHPVTYEAGPRCWLPRHPRHNSPLAAASPPHVRRAVVGASSESPSPTHSPVHTHGNPAASQIRGADPKDYPSLPRHSKFQTKSTSRSAPIAAARLLAAPYKSTLPTIIASSASERQERVGDGGGEEEPGVIALFDVDGTLTAPRKAATPEMLEFMKQLRENVTMGVVGGSDLVKISEQLGRSVINDYDYCFSENGLVAHKNGELIGTQSLKSFLGEAKLKEFINFTLHYIADLDIPIKRGTFVEFRSGMLNVSPIGRNCSQEERDAFEKYDKVHNVRPKMVSVLRERFAHLNLTFSIGGQISFDVFPQGWDKTYCLRYLEEFQEIHFFGDKTYQGGNDYEIFVSDRTIGHTATSPEDTAQQCRSLFMSK